jgi:hypothetical protein
MFYLLLALFAVGRAQSMCAVANATLAPRMAVLPTAVLTLSVNVSGFGVTRVTEAGSDDDVAMEFSNLTLIVPLKGDVLSPLRLPNETAQASVVLSAPAVCDLRDWGTAGRITPPIARVLVSGAAVDLQGSSSVVDRIPFATWSGPALAMRVVAFERDASQNDCRYYPGDDDLSNSTFTNQLCAVESAVCTTTIGANMDGWQAAGLYEFRLAPSWSLSGTRRNLVLTAATFLDVVPLSTVAAATRTLSAPYEFVAVNASAGAGLRFHLDADANLVRHLHCSTLVLASAGSVVQLRFAAPFNASRNADRRVGDGVYNVTLVPLVRARQAVQLVDCLQPALELDGAGSEWALLSYGFVLAPLDQLSVWFVIGSIVTTTTAAASSSTTVAASTTKVSTVSSSTSSRLTTSATVSAVSVTTITATMATTTAATATSGQITAPTTLSLGATMATTTPHGSGSASATANASAIIANTASPLLSGSLVQTGAAPDDNMTVIIGGVVGAAVGVVVLISIAVVVVRYRRRNRPLPASANETALQSPSVVSRQQYGPSPVFVPSSYGPGPAEAPSSAYAVSVSEFKIAEASSYGVFTDLEGGARAEAEIGGVNTR